MSAMFNPDAVDFTPGFSSLLSPFAAEFSLEAPGFQPSAAEFIPQSLIQSPGKTQEAEKQTESAPPLSDDSTSPLPADVPEVKHPLTECKEEVSAPQEASRRQYSREFVLSFRDSCKALPPTAAIPDNYSASKGKKNGNRSKPTPGEKWTTLPVYTLATSANSFANYVKSLTSEQEKEIQQVRLLINKISETNYAKLSQQLFENYDYSGYLLEKLTWLIYERATMHHNFSEMYARLCVDLKAKFAEVGKAETAKKFRVYILEKCEKAFYKQEVVEGNELIDAETKRKVRLAGNVKFIGFLFQLRFVSSRVIHECFRVQLNEHTLSDESIETFCMLFTSVAPLLRTRTKDSQSEAAELSEAYERVVSLRTDERFSIRIRFMIQSLIEKRGELLAGDSHSSRLPSAPSRETPAKSTEATCEVRRVKILPEVLKELKELLALQKKSLPAKMVGQKVHSLCAKYSLHRPEVVYQICRFALSESNQGDMDYWSNLIIKSFQKRKNIQTAINEGLEIAVVNLKDLRLDCPMAEEWIREILNGVKERGGLSNDQVESLSRKVEGETAEEQKETSAAVFEAETTDLAVRGIDRPAQSQSCGSS